MTTIYQPTGQVAPVPDYVLPQDVIDLVVVETVNNPFVTSADNIAWFALMFAATCSVKNFGAVGDGVANDTAAIQSALDARVFVFFPEGGYRVVGKLNVHKSAYLFGVRGNSYLFKDHATEHFFEFADNGTFAQFVDLGISGAQSNTGNVFRSTGTRVNLVFRGCDVNSDGLLIGKLINGTTQTVLIDGACSFKSRSTEAAYAISADRIAIQPGARLEMAPAATFPLLASGTQLVIDGPRLIHVSTLGDLAFVDCATGVVLASNVIIDVNDSAAGGPTYGFKLNNGLLKTKNITLAGDALLYQFSAPAAAGSDLELRPTVIVADGNASFGLPYGVRMASIDASNAAPPHIELPRILFPGQLFTAIVQNGSVGDWSGAFVLTAHIGEGILDAGASEFSDLRQGRACAVSFFAADHFGGLIWIQAGASAQVPP